MITMHGLFDLCDGIGEDAFGRDFRSFSQYLKGANLIENWRYMEHQPHDGYNSGEPTTKYYVAVDFVDMDQAQRCWDEIEEQNEPLDTLHTAVLKKLSNYQFFLTRQIADT